MTGELGQLALCFALGLSLVMAGAGLMGARVDGAAARGIANGAAMGMLVFVALAFGTLVAAFVTSDFSVALVADHSHTLKPLVYKISGVWGNHEGSMLLWVLVLALYSGAVSYAQRGSARLTSAALGFQGLCEGSDGGGVGGEQDRAVEEDDRWERGCPRPLLETSRWR